jgi:hypothetical protein
MSAPRIARAAAAGILGLGAAFSFLEAPGLSRVPGPVEAWVADRGSSRVLGLDEDWIPAQGCALPHPFLLAARPDGGAWVVGARDRARDAGQELFLVERGSSRPRALARVAGARELVCARSGDAFLLEIPGGQSAARVRRFRDDGSTDTLLHGRPARTLAMREERLAVGCSDGWLLVLQVEPLPLLRRHLHFPAGVRDLEPARGGGWWVLCDGVPARLVLLSAELREVWGRSTTASSALVRGSGEGVWLLDVGEGMLRSFDRGGRLAIEAASPLLRAVEDAVVLAGGGSLLAGAGALLELDASGRARRSQGGFEYLVAVDRWQTH